jgi:hypothetical protein
LLLRADKAEVLEIFLSFTCLSKVDLTAFIQNNDLVKELEIESVSR